MLGAESKIAAFFTGRAAALFLRAESPFAATLFAEAFARAAFKFFALASAATLPNSAPMFTALRPLAGRILTQIALVIDPAARGSFLRRGAGFHRYFANQSFIEIIAQQVIERQWFGQ